MLGTMMLAGLGCAALMRNPRRKRAKSRRRNPDDFVKGQLVWSTKWGQRFQFPFDPIESGDRSKVKFTEPASHKGVTMGSIVVETLRPVTSSNPRKGAKTYLARILQSYYPGAGWSDVLEEETSREMKAQLKTYRANDPGTPYRVIHRRVKIETATNPRRRSKRRNRR